jgi:hypothetical protein
VRDVVADGLGRDAEDFRKVRVTLAVGDSSERLAPGAREAGGTKRGEL